MSTDDLRVFISQKLNKEFHFKKLKHRTLIDRVVAEFRSSSNAEYVETKAVERCAEDMKSLIISERDETWQTILEMFHHTGIDSFLKLQLVDEPIKFPNRNLFVHQFSVALSLLKHRAHLLGIFINSEWKLEERIKQIEPELERVY